MTEAILTWEKLGEYGELRTFRRSGPPWHLAIEILREVDGRAWTLRIPLDELRALMTVLRSASARLGAPSELVFDEDGTAVLTSDRLRGDRELYALVLQQNDDLIFALWTREHLRSGWSWSLDAVFVPIDLYRSFIDLLFKAIEAAKQPNAGHMPNLRMAQPGVSFP
ncbi:hypothetical protein SAMN07250955_103106 [Arboricoccus pini]|uniref:Uncharacterized protein n=1 Tax=Arboricoccus pini TaxID=1963835 RepID=A0A212QS27_9PROT|nr:hypothetical protein [Arboricoccus pini]SNB62388.1 hypothetical protein SAMN07250955_103106 [Arboricoccus pini]